MLEIEILEVVMLWVIDPYVNSDITKNDDQGNGREKGNKSGINPPMSEGSIVGDYNEEVLWSDQGGC